MKHILLSFFVMIIMTGCQPNRKDASAPSEKTSAVHKTIEDVTGRTTTRAGKRTMKKIEDINATRKENFEELNQ